MQIRDFFVERGHELTHNPTIEWVAQLGEGKAVRGLVMKGLARSAHRGKA